MQKAGFIVTAILLAAVAAPGQQRVWPMEPQQRVWALTPPSSSAGTSFLGVGVADIDDQRAKDLKLPQAQGVEIRKVAEGSPAEKAGLKEHDVVLEYNGQQVEGTEGFMRMVRETPVGHTVKLLVSRGGSTMTVTAKIGQRRDFERAYAMPGMPAMPAMPPMPPIDIPRPLMALRAARIGLELETLGEQLSEYFGVKEGVLVRSVEKDSPAEKAGLKAGDVIVKAGDERISRPGDLTDALRAEWDKKTVSLQVVRNKKEMTLNLQLPERSSNEPWGHTVARPEKM